MFLILFFFIPQTILFISNNELKVETFLSKNEIDKIIDDLKNEKDFDEKDNSVELQFTEDKENYIQKIRKIKEHIQQRRYL